MMFAFSVLLGILLAPQVVLGENMNLTGNLNINDIQETSNTNLLLSLVISVAESVIPIVAGALVGHKAIKYWQEKKEKIATKDSVLSDYSQSFKRRGTLLDCFVNRIFGAYITFERDVNSQLIAIKDYTDVDHDIEGFLKFPSDVNELPSKTFIEEYKDLTLEMDKAAHVRNHLYMNLGFYYKDSDKTAKKLEHIESLLDKLELVVNKFFHSTNKSDFVRFRDSYFSIRDKISDEVKDIELELSQLRFR